MFQSTSAILISGLITFWLLLTVCLRQNPFLVMHRFFQDLLRSRLLMIHLLGALSILIVNKLELLMESRLTEYAEPLTPYIRMFEGNVTPLIQHVFQHPALTHVTTFFYVILFTVWMFASLFIYHHERDRRSLYTVMYAIAINYLLAIPFFLFAPVEETWAAHPDIQFLVPQVYPAFEEQYRHFSGLDNSFPSLHTSISVTLAVIAYHSRNRMFARISCVSCGGILFSILYLGIHWYLDLAAGVVLGLFSVTLAYRFSDFPLGVRRLSIRPSQKTASEQVSNAS